MIEQLFQIQDPAAFLEEFKRLWQADADKERLLRKICVRVAPKIHRAEYNAGDTFGYMGLIAAIQAGKWMPPPVRMDPVIQSLWAIADEPLCEPFAGVTAPTDCDEATLRQSLQEIWAAGDTGAVCASLRTLPDAVAMESVTPWLFRQTLTDAWDYGRRFAYMVSATRLCRWAQWETGDMLLFPAIHYCLNAPHEDGDIEWLRTILDHNPIRQDHVSGDGDQISDTQAEYLTRLALSNDSEGLVAHSLSILSDGAGARALLDGLIVAAARLIDGADMREWYAPLNAFIYLGALSDVFEEFDPILQVELVLCAGLLIQQAAGALEHLNLDSEEAIIREREPMVSFAVWANLAQALDQKDEDKAFAIMGSAVGTGFDELTFASFLATYASRNDGRLYGTLDLQFVCAAILAMTRAMPDVKTRLLATILRFLSRCDKDHELWRRISQVF